MCKCVDTKINTDIFKSLTLGFLHYSHCKNQFYRKLTYSKREMVTIIGKRSDQHKIIHHIDDSTQKSFAELLYTEKRYAEKINTNFF